jgi:hypothetical protein
MFGVRGQTWHSWARKDSWYVHSTFGICGAAELAQSACSTGARKRMSRRGRILQHISESTLHSSVGNENHNSVGDVQDGDRGGAPLTKISLLHAPTARSSASIICHADLVSRLRAHEAQSSWTQSRDANDANLRSDVKIIDAERRPRAQKPREVRHGATKTEGRTQGSRFPLSRDAIGHTCCQTSGRLAPMHVIPRVQELQQKAGHHCSLYFLVCT